MNNDKVIECYYFGKAYPLHLSYDPSVKKALIDFDGHSLHLRSPVSGQIAIEPLLQSFYAKALKKYISEKIAEYQVHFKVKPKGFTIEDSKLRWGSCNSGRQLTFNWRLAMLEKDVIDYVIIHEMCHLVHLNHDRSFWRLVGKLMPDYKSAMAYLGNTKRTE